LQTLPPKLRCRAIALEDGVASTYAALIEEFEAGVAW